jgi:chorismate mutase
MITVYLDGAKMGAEWQVRAIRGATTVNDNTAEAMTAAVLELLAALEDRNHLDPQDMISAIFTATQDLDAIFPAQVARQRPRWDGVALMDVQQMHVAGSLPYCIRVLVHANVPSNRSIDHVYLRGASNLRPDLAPCSV